MNRLQLSVPVIACLASLYGVGCGGGEVVVHGPPRPAREIVVAAPPVVAPAPPQVVVQAPAVAAPVVEVAPQEVVVKTKPPVERVEVMTVARAPTTSGSRGTGTGTVASGCGTPVTGRSVASVSSGTPRTTSSVAAESRRRRPLRSADPPTAAVDWTRARRNPSVRPVCFVPPPPPAAQLRASEEPQAHRVSVTAPSERGAPGPPSLRHSSERARSPRPTEPPSQLRAPRGAPGPPSLRHSSEPREEPRAHRAQPRQPPSTEPRSPAAFAETKRCLGADEEPYSRTATIPDDGSAPVSAKDAGDLVELTGIEPVTSCMPCMRSPS